ncbi:hypothetical protein M406DRAFT_273933 [Cryphonectria parasitica EP155]|uniref:Uncharacterized protein n=1 Tax=Cryphonectria parasitica (strain ATCC 38755 / EP155) TaxID=660469 RepID=A0A9P5CTN0_CRYP1|nr:uncharacterized protein M406DRAFT_273933 [Cryphonectria parasitica EP155]KAF3769310.1 hypothetical protein M406DRAFT_273933 [Cryphonectria parasitica EP155]
MLSAKIEEKPTEKTPITPPLAYMDFLKTINPASPAMASPPLTAPLPSKASLKRTSTGDSVETVQTIKTEDAPDSTTEEEIDSAPTSATTTDSTATDCSCPDGDHKDKASKPSPAPISTRHPASPAATYPLSAPATGPATFPSLRVPPSPAVDSPVRSPWSARSLKSPFDWEAALKARRHAEVLLPAPTSAGPTSAGAQAGRCEKKGTSVRHIREVVTRTVTYTPRMDPAPRGKRRKLNDASAE